MPVQQDGAALRLGVGERGEHVEPVDARRSAGPPPPPSACCSRASRSPSPPDVQTTTRNPAAHATRRIRSSTRRPRRRRSAGPGTGLSLGQPPGATPPQACTVQRERYRSQRGNRQAGAFLDHGRGWSRPGMRPIERNSMWWRPERTNGPPDRLGRSAPGRRRAAGPAGLQYDAGAPRAPPAASRPRTAAPDASGRRCRGGADPRQRSAYAPPRATSA